MLRRGHARSLRQQLRLDYRRSDPDFGHAEECALARHPPADRRRREFPYARARSVVRAMTGPPVAQAIAAAVDE